MTLFKEDKKYLSAIKDLYDRGHLSEREKKFFVDFLKEKEAEKEFCVQAVKAPKKKSEARADKFYTLCVSMEHKLASYKQQIKQFHEREKGVFKEIEDLNKQLKRSREERDKQIFNKNHYTQVCLHLDEAVVEISKLEKNNNILREGHHKELTNLRSKRKLLYEEIEDLRKVAGRQAQKYINDIKDREFKRAQRQNAHEEYKAQMVTKCNRLEEQLSASRVKVSELTPKPLNSYLKRIRQVGAWLKKLGRVFDPLFGPGYEKEK